MRTHLHGYLFIYINSTVQILIHWEKCSYTTETEVGKLHTSVSTKATKANTFQSLGREGQQVWCAQDKDSRLVPPK